MAYQGSSPGSTAVCECVGCGQHRQLRRLHNPLWNTKVKKGREIVHLLERPLKLSFSPKYEQPLQSADDIVVAILQSLPSGRHSIAAPSLGSEWQFRSHVHSLRATLHGIIVSANLILESVLHVNTHRDL